MFQDLGNANNIKYYQAHNIITRGIELENIGGSEDQINTHEETP